MAKRHLLVDASTTLAKQPKQAKATNWELCALCQEDTGDVLQCPVNSTKAPIGSGYKSLAEHLVKFQELGQMPIEVDMNRLDEGNGIEATLKAHSASWHKSCRLKFNQTKLERLQKKQADQNSNTSSAVHTRGSQSSVKVSDCVCFFCEKPGGLFGLHEVSTKEVDWKVRKCALELEDTNLIAKLAPADMIALEAKYHTKCLLKLYDSAKQAGNTLADPDGHLHGIAFAELVSYMDEYRIEESVNPVFKLADMANIYKARLVQLGAAVDGRIHSTRLKMRLLSVFPDLREYKEGCNVLLTFDTDIADALQKACEHDNYDNDAMHLARAAQVVRRDMFRRKFTFDGSFKPGCQEDAVPPSLLALVNMIQEGPSIKHQTEAATSNAAALSISQLVIFNSVKHHRRSDTAGLTRHSLDRETPLPLYLAMKVHAVTRSKNLIDAMFNLGLCVSYDRFLQVTSDIANGVCQQFTVDDIVCPSKMRRGLFTTAAVDNIDYNPSSATAKDSFHGTGISLMQLPTHQFAGHDRGVLVINHSSSSSKSVAPLPTKYTSVPPAALSTKQFTAPAIGCPVKPPNLETLEQATNGEYEWLNKVKAALEKQQLDETDWISWAAYHASVQEAVNPPAAITGLLPLFTDSAHSVAMIKHAMTIVQAAVRHLNPGQVPIIAADQPLYAIAKQIQWSSPTTLGEDHFVVMFGGLHIEMAILKVSKTVMLR